MRSIHGLLVCTAAFAALCAAACTDVNTSVCERATMCRPASDADIEACASELDSDEDRASIYDCDGPWDDYVHCLDDTGVCDGDRLTGCDPYQDAYHRCLEAHGAHDIHVDLRAP